MCVFRPVATTLAQVKLESLKEQEQFYLITPLYIHKPTKN